MPPTRLRLVGESHGSRNSVVDTGCADSDHSARCDVLALTDGWSSGVGLGRQGQALPRISIESAHGAGTGRVRARTRACA